MTQPDQTAVVVLKAYDFSLWFLPKGEKFSRAHRWVILSAIKKARYERVLQLTEG